MSTSTIFAIGYIRPDKLVTNVTTINFIIIIIKRHLAGRRHPTKSIEIKSDLSQVCSPPISNEIIASIDRESTGGPFSINTEKKSWFTDALHM